jgi:probable rRNA maturation factor
MTTLIYDRESAYLPDGDILAHMKRAACLVCEAEGLRGAEISLSFVAPDDIRRLNAEYRGKDEVTDVLSFPQHDRAGAAVQSGAGESAPVGDAPLLLGDVVVCTDRARAQAAEYGHDAARECVYLFVHGLLHLLGYDHMEDADKKRMRAVEKAVTLRLFRDAASEGGSAPDETTEADA